MEDKAMLKAKYYHEFKDCKNCILIIGNTDSYKTASLYFGRLNGGIFAPSKHIVFENENEIEGNHLLLTKSECISFAEICSKLATQESASHEYFSIESMPGAEFIVSYNEYESLP
jgi:hypothetical protein